jgi:MarR family transcriptional regulator, negative regulator of the multidrug operon emrRAB
MDHDLNVIGAAVVMLGDRIRDATEDASGMGGALPAALSALHVWAGGRTIETLAGGLRLSHSRTVRVVDRLAADGLATRSRDPADGRGVLVQLTPAGHRAGRRVLEARAAALEEAVGDAERAELAGIAERLLARATTSRRAARTICRLCDAQACGHHDGRCPVTRAADAAEAVR